LKAKHREKKTMKKVEKAQILKHLGFVMKREAMFTYNESLKAHFEAHQKEGTIHMKAENATKMEAFAANRLKSSDHHPNAEDFSKWGDDGLYSDMNKVGLGVRG